MRRIALAGLFVPALAFAAAGFADAFNDHRHWIFPAYMYCLIFGLIILCGLFILSLVYKTKTKEISGKASAYLVIHPITAIIVADVLLGVPLGIIGAVAGQIFWFLALFPIFGMVIALPLTLVERPFREKFLVSPFTLKWTCMISVSAVIASLLFIVLTNCVMLPGTDITYYARPNVFHNAHYFPTHPYDSIIEIWELPLIFIAEFPIALLLYGLGVLARYVFKKIFKPRAPKPPVFRDSL